ncbi:MAG: cytochrome c3 family protein [Coriobacteriia bacterium]|nr:cytochrome c3 family protein [Coriobacteriia bacterium]
MAKISLAGFKDPVRRPRYIIWTGVVLIGLIAFVAVALAVSSSRLFCAQVCHKVQDDAIIAYEKSSHSEISCLACHMPVNSDTVTFLIHKVEAGVSGAVNTLGNTYEMPLNPGSKLSLEGKYMPEGQCTQCHSKNRKVTPSPGILIDHAIHSEKKITCTTCHNRVGHNEDGWELTLKTVEGKPSKKHPDYMKMMWCYRCHDLESKKTAPGTCATCHTPDFPLKPANHLVAEFYPKGHAELALQDEEQYKEREKEHEELAAKVEAKHGDPNMLLPVSYCGTCHIKTKFCDSCHGMEIPHPEEFKTKSHPEVVKTAAAKCVMCHGEPAKTGFCDDCHHGKKVAWTFDVKIPWKTQHAAAVTKNGIDKCFTACHDQKFCLDCHTKTKPLPGSHKAATWLHRANSDPFAKDKAIHATNATSNIKACEICHGAGGTTSAFCMGCHKQAMPHPAEFKSFHAKTGRTSTKVCANCHQFKELCSNCHHKGSSTTTSWMPLHGKVVAQNGSAADCFAKCHKKDFCVACHTGRKVVPASHKAKDWTRRAKLDSKALHPAGFTKDQENCSYCHGDGGATAKFCVACHKLPMPHPGGFKDSHKADFQAKKVTKPQCVNCHTQQFCDKCHHEYTAAEPWRTAHDTVVKEGDPQKCFKCHKETFCSYCHVRLIH